jgi:hypothetical protein
MRAKPKNHGLNAITPIRGYCPRHKRVLAWCGHPLLRDALCPLGCDTKLERCTPRTRGEIVDARPLTTEDPAHA